MSIDLGKKLSLLGFIEILNVNTSVVRKYTAPSSHTLTVSYIVTPHKAKSPYRVETYAVEIYHTTDKIDQLGTDYLLP